MLTTAGGCPGTGMGGCVKGEAFGTELVTFLTSASTALESVGASPCA